jgi:(E)-4-hydroxy-3-methylbut-2-enyl-diphosphate synthase
LPILCKTTISIIGCVVNGPGEARSTDVGITGGGKGTHQIYLNGIPDHVIKNQSVVDHVVNEVRKKLSSLN